jgi:hypothetical protein
VTNRRRRQKRSWQERGRFGRGAKQESGIVDVLSGGVNERAQTSCNKLGWMRVPRADDGMASRVFASTQRCERFAAASASVRTMSGSAARPRRGIDRQQTDTQHVRGAGSRPLGLASAFRQRLRVDRFGCKWGQSPFLSVPEKGTVPISSIRRICDVCRPV